MKIIVDTREQKYDHVKCEFEKQKVPWFRSKCIVGDYYEFSNPNLVIDRKKDLQEVAGNVCQQHERFTNELTLANELGVKLIVLIEEPKIKSVDEVVTWYNWRRKKNPKAITGKTLFKIMKTMTEKYGVEWRFTTKENCGKTIIKILQGDK